MTEERTSSWGQLRLIIVIAIGAAAVILAAQNNEPVTTKFLMFEATVPRFLLILLTAFFGFLAGYLARSWWRRR